MKHDPTQFRFVYSSGLFEKSDAVTVSLVESIPLTYSASLGLQAVTEEKESATENRNRKK